MVLIRPQGINQPGQMTYTQPSLFNIVSELLQSMGEAVSEAAKAEFPLTTLSIR